MEFADLHIHTNYSDSSLSCEVVAEDAHKSGLRCIAITDHDTFKGIEPTMTASLQYGIEVLPGIELSSEINGKDVHILGYLFDHKNESFKEELRIIQDTRMSRMQKMIDKLKELGIDNISLEEVCALVESRAVGRPHLAEILKQKGVVSDFKEAFDKYIAEGAPAYFPKFKQTPYAAIKLIRDFGGVAVLAHPMITCVDELIPSFVKEGLRGIEVFYPNASRAAMDFYKGIAKKHNLLVTGGSDCHGNDRAHSSIGSVKIDYEYVEQLKKEAKDAS